MATPDVVRADHLTKRYGSARGVDDLSFHVAEGERFGFLGAERCRRDHDDPHRSLDFIRPTSGHGARLRLGPAPEGVKVHEPVGYLPGELSLFYERMTAQEFLRTFAGLRGRGRVVVRHRSCASASISTPTKQIRALSHGNKQKVGLVQAFMHRPDLLILDEPTQGLDPLMQQAFYTLIDQEVRERGATVFLSSHVLPEVERVCDRVGIIRDGGLVTVADIGDLKAKARRRISSTSTAAVDRSEAFARLPGVLDVSVHGDSIMLTVEGPLDAVVKEAARHTVVTVETHQPSLEEAFLGFYRTRPETGATSMSALLHHDLASTAACVPRLGGWARRGRRCVCGVLPEHPRQRRRLPGLHDKLPEALRTPDRQRLHDAGRLPAQRDLQHARV